MDQKLFLIASHHKATDRDDKPSVLSNSTDTQNVSCRGLCGTVEIIFRKYMLNMDWLVSTSNPQLSVFM